VRRSRAAPQPAALDRHGLLIHIDVGMDRPRAPGVETEIMT
jgi:hypothetical protein